MNSPDIDNSMDAIDGLRCAIKKKLDHHSSLLKAVAEKLRKQYKEEDEDDAESKAIEKQRFDEAFLKVAIPLKNQIKEMEEVLHFLMKDSKTFQEIQKQHANKIEQLKNVIDFSKNSQTDVAKALTKFSEEMSHLSARVTRVESQHEQFEQKLDSHKTGQNSVNLAITETLQTIAQEIVNQRDVLVRLIELSSSSPPLGEPDLLEGQDDPDIGKTTDLKPVTSWAKKAYSSRIWPHSRSNHFPRTQKPVVKRQSFV